MERFIPELQSHILLITEQKIKPSGANTENGHSIWKALKILKENMELFYYKN